jgi:hypothetical protein
MEIAVIIIVAILFFFVIPYLRKKIWRKATGEDKKVPTLDSNETSMNEILVASPEVKFKSFAISSRGQGRLFYTDKKRVLFTSLNGKEIGLDIKFDQIQEVVVQEKLMSTKLIIKYTDENGQQRSNSFKYAPTTTRPQIGEDKKVLNEWKIELEKHLK